MSPKRTKKTHDTYRFPKTSKPRTKSAMIQALSLATELPKKSVATALAALTVLVGEDLAKHGVFTLPAVAKLTVIKKKATKARKGINPFTGEPTVFKAKPARKVVRIRALKGLKDAVA